VILPIAIFAAVTLTLFAGLALAASTVAAEPSRTRKRLAEEFAANPKSSPEGPLFKNPEKLQLPGSSDARFGVKAGPRLVLERIGGGLGSLQLLLDQAHLPWSARQFAAGALALAVALGVAAYLLWGILAGLAGGLLGIGLSFYIVLAKNRSRREAMLKQLPHAFDLMARVLRAGNPVPYALQCVADSFDDPVATEFANCRRQQDLGLRPEVTYHDMARQWGILELHIFVMAMLIQRECGGNLSTILERLAALVRSRLRLRQQIQSLTAEGRLQGLTLIVLPFLMFGVLYVINRDYASVLLDHPGLLAATVGFMLLGVVWIRKIVRYDP
jgi:tight adherence protein B